MHHLTCLVIYLTTVLQDDDVQRTLLTLIKLYYKNKSPITVIRTMKKRRHEIVNVSKGSIHVLYIEHKFIMSPKRISNLRRNNDRYYETPCTYIYNTGRY